MADATETVAPTRNERRDMSMGASQWSVRDGPPTSERSLLVELASDYHGRVRIWVDAADNAAPQFRAQVPPRSFLFITQEHFAPFSSRRDKHMLL